MLNVIEANVMRKLLSTGYANTHAHDAQTTGGIIWEVEGRGSGGKGVAYHTDSPTQVEDLGLRLGLVSLYDVLPPYYHSPDLPPPK